MTLKLLFTISTILCVLFGLAFLLAPVQIMSVYGIDLDISAQYIARYYGAAFLGFGLIFWFTRNGDPQDKIMRGILLGGLVVNIIALINAVLDALFGPGAFPDWYTVTIYVLMTIGFGYFYIRK